MKRISHLLVLGGAILSLTALTPSLNAQEQKGEPKGEPNRGGTDRNRRGAFNPDEFRQRMQERMKEQFGVTNDDEWKLIYERIEKVFEARRGTTGGFGGFGGPGGPPGGFRGGPGGPGGGDRPDGDRGRGREGNPDVEALQKAIEAKASNDEIKAKLAKVRESRQENQVKLEKAQDELRAVLNLRQEATAVLMGLLP
jgi:hypothetical protein